MSLFKDKDRYFSRKGDLYLANKYNGKMEGYDENCVKAAVTYLSRLQGKDVTALPTYDMKNDVVASNWNKVYNGFRSEYCGENPKDFIESKMNNAGDNALGMIRLNYFYEGTLNGHVFTVEKIDGKIFYKDPQINVTDASVYFENSRFFGFEFGIVDGCKPTDLAYLCMRNRFDNE